MTREAVIPTFSSSKRTCILYVLLLFSFFLNVGTRPPFTRPPGTRLPTGPPRTRPPGTRPPFTRPPYVTRLPTGPPQTRPPVTDLCAVVRCAQHTYCQINSTTGRAACVPDCQRDNGGCPQDQLCEVASYCRRRGRDSTECEEYTFYPKCKAAPFGEYQSHNMITVNWAQLFS